MFVLHPRFNSVRPFIFIHLCILLEKFFDSQFLRINIKLPEKGQELF